MLTSATTAPTLTLIPGGLPDVGRYIDHMIGSGLAERTVAERGFLAHRLVREWGTLDVSAAQVARWLNAYRGWTKLTYYRTLLSLFDWATANGHAAANPMDGMRRPATPGPRPAPLDDDELERAYASPTDRIRAFLLLGHRAGLRAHEIAKFHGADINRDTLTVDGKGGVIDELPTHPELWALAADFPRDGYWFPSPAAHRDFITAHSVIVPVAEYFTGVNIAGGVHRMRHTYCTDLIRAGHDLALVKSLTRHRSLNTLNRYAGVRQADRRAAILGLGQAAERPSEAAA